VTPPIADRLERLEDWRVDAERRAERLLSRVGELARSVERYAGALERMGEKLEALLDAQERERIERAQLGRIRRALHGAAGLVIAALGVIVGRSW